MPKKLFVLILVILLFIVSCSKSASSPEVYQSSNAAFDHSNVYYVEDHAGIRYLNFSTGESGALCYNPLCSHQVGECPAYIQNWGEFMGGIAAVRENCVYYVKNFQNDSMKNEGFGIVEYDAVSGISKVLLSGLPDLITQFVVRGDDIFYFMNSYGENGNGIRNIYRYSMKTQKTEMLTEGIEQNLLFFDSEGDSVYLEDLDLGIVYQTDWTFGELKEFKKFDNIYTYFYIHDQYLYYFVDSGKVEDLSWSRIIDGSPCKEEEPFQYHYTSQNLVRVPLDNVNTEPKVILENVQGSANMKFKGNKMLCVLSDPEYIKSYRIETMDIKTGEPTIALRDVYSAYGDLVAIDLDTLETEVLCPGDKYDITDIYYWDDEQLIFYGTDIEAESEEGAGEARVSIVKMNLSTGESTVLWENNT